MRGCFEVNCFTAQPLLMHKCFLLPAACIGTSTSYVLLPSSRLSEIRVPRQNTGSCDHHGYPRPKKVKTQFWLEFPSVFALPAPWTFWPRETWAVTFLVTQNWLIETPDCNLLGDISILIKSCGDQTLNMTLPECLGFPEELCFFPEPISQSI